MLCMLAIHKHIFGDVYEWAGTIRTIPMVKGECVLGGDTVRYSQPDYIERDCAAVFKRIIDQRSPWKPFDFYCNKVTLRV